MSKLLKPSLTYGIPIFTSLLYLCIMMAGYFYERDEKRQEVINHEVAHLKLHLVRMQHVVNSALAIDDSARIEQEISLAAANLGVMVYTVLNSKSIIRFSNHLVWRDSQASEIIDGYDLYLHQRVAGEHLPLTVVNARRLSIQAYYPLKTLHQNNKEDIHDLIYLEYDISPLLKSSDQHVQASFIRFIGVSLVGLLFFLVLLHVYLISPLRALSVQAKNCTKYSKGFFGFNEQPVLAVFSEVVAIQEHLRNLSNVLTHRKKQLNDSQIRWLFAVEISENRIWGWNLITNEVFLSERWKEMLGYEADELNHQFNTWQELLHPEDKPEVLSNLKRYLNNGVKELESVYRLKHKQGHYVCVLDRGLVVDWDEAGGPIRMIGFHANVSDDVSDKQAIMHQTKHDILTGLANL